MAAPLDYKEERARKRRERAKDRQKELTLEVTEETIDWTKIEVFMYFDDEDLNPNHTDRHTQVTTAMLACYEGQTEILRWCLSSKADVDARSSLGRCALHYACDGNKAPCIRLLLESVADPNMRTLSMMTPLHICCQNDNYEAVLVLLREAKETVDPNAENSRRQTPSKLAKDKRILRVINKHHNELDGKKKAELLEQVLRRLFRLFDVDGNDYIFPEEWAETHGLLAQYFENHSDEYTDTIFEMADKNHDGRIDWQEFKSSHVEMLEAFGMPHKEVLYRVNDLECQIFQERQRIIEEAADGDESGCRSPCISTRAKKMSLQRAQGELENAQS